MLTGIKEGRDIILLEGEKDCDNAEKIGLVATTFAGGVLGNGVKSIQNCSKMQKWYVYQITTLLVVKG